MLSHKIPPFYSSGENILQICAEVHSPPLPAIQKMPFKSIKYTKEQRDLGKKRR